MFLTPTLLDDPTAADAGLSSRNGLTVPDAVAMLGVLGLPQNLGEEFPCALPGFEGIPNSVVDPPSLRYQTLYQGAPRPWLSLAEVHASQTAGRLVICRNAASHARWWLRLRHAAGLVEAALPTLTLPPRLSLAALRLARGFALALALSETQHPGEPISYSRRFAMDWCGLPERATAEGLRELRAAGVLIEAGRLDTPGRQPTSLYLLATEPVRGEDTASLELATA
jgi:hypothetical protein